MTHYILSRDPEFSAGWAAAKNYRDATAHLQRAQIDRVTPGDKVTILGNWADGLTRYDRVRIEKALHDSRADIENGAGYQYDWGSPRPWEHDGNEPGSAVS